MSLKYYQYAGTSNSNNYLEELHFSCFTQRTIFKDTGFLLRVLSRIRAGKYRSERKRILVYSTLCYCKK